jgi:two-component system, chemotaxis family, chemotaxis protein CheY
MAKTILIVDDSASLRQLVKITLTGAGYDVIEAENGQKALDQFDGKKIHLVISDVNMPIMDGITFVTKMKAIAAYKFTPVIMLTTESSSDMKVQGQAAGAKAWVVKPFKPEMILAAVAQLILP